VRLESKLKMKFEKVNEKLVFKFGVGLGAGGRGGVGWEVGGWGGCRGNFLTIS